jgi:hypothetical protein
MPPSASAPSRLTCPLVTKITSRFWGRAKAATSSASSNESTGSEYVNAIEAHPRRSVAETISAALHVSAASPGSAPARRRCDSPSFWQNGQTRLHPADAIENVVLPGL